MVNFIFGSFVTLPIVLHDGILYSTQFNWLYIYAYRRFSIHAAKCNFNLCKCSPVLSLVPLAGCPVDTWLYKPHWTDRDQSFSQWGSWTDPNNIHIHIQNCPVAQTEEHSASNAKVMDWIPRDIKNWSNVYRVASYKSICHMYKCTCKM